MKRARSMHEFGMWWLMRFGTGAVPFETNSAIEKEIWDMLPNKFSHVNALSWEGWVTERRVIYYTLTPKALAHIAKYNKGHTK